MEVDGLELDALAPQEELVASIAGLEASLGSKGRMHRLPDARSRSHQQECTTLTPRTYASRCKPRR